MPTQPSVWRELHFAISLAYAAHHGYDLFYADVSVGCSMLEARFPAWCTKLGAFAVLFDEWEGRRTYDCINSGISNSRTFSPIENFSCTPRLNA